MDVYFAALKYESVEQLKGYETLDFLSKSTESIVSLFSTYSFALKKCHCMYTAGLSIINQL